jgi:hypothetical protein
MWIDFLQSKGIFAVGCVVRATGIRVGILTIAPRTLAPGPTAILYDENQTPYPAVVLPGWVGGSDYNIELPYVAFQDTAPSP